MNAATAIATLKSMRAQSVARMGWAKKATSLSDPERAAMHAQAAAEVAALDYVVGAIGASRDVELRLSKVEAGRVMSMCFIVARKHYWRQVERQFVPAPGKANMDVVKQEMFARVGEQLSAKGGFGKRFDPKAEGGQADV